MAKRTRTPKGGGPPPDGALPPDPSAEPVPVPIPAPADRVRNQSIEEELRASYLTYAMSVIVSRALPDARDGLKPSQRRILYAMNELGLGPGAKSKKCANIVGETMGKYHPHGDQSIYPTLVRLAQDFNLRYPLIRSQGNFGSIDGDPPAAMRYTEAKLTPLGMEMLEDLDYDTVDFVPNFDESRTEPTVLTGKFPSLLANGSVGIAVGMATSIPPHNLRELAAAITLVIDNPNASLDEIIAVLPAPDFPTHGVLCGTAGVRAGYATGRGRVVLRGRAEIETEKSGRHRIVIREVPYQVSPTSIIDRISDLVKEDALDSVSEVRNLSSREGLRIVVELKKGEDPNVVLNQLYEMTPLQSSFSILLLALTKGEPRVLPLKDLLLLYRDHRVEVIRRRTTFLKKRAEERAHILEGLKIALRHIDEVIEIIKKSEDVPAASRALRARFGLSELQTAAILSMPLSKLTNLEQDKMDEEYRDLIQKIEYYRAILGSESMIHGLIKEDLRLLAEKHGDARRTEISPAEVGDFVPESLIPSETVAVTLTRAGYMKRLPLTEYRSQRHGGKGVTAADVREGDVIERILVANTHDVLLFFTNRGRVYAEKVYKIPEMVRSARGRAVANLLDFKEGEALAGLITVRTGEMGHLLFATEKGLVKRTALAEYANVHSGGIIAITLLEGDRLIGVDIIRGGEEILLASREGLAIRFPESAARPMGRPATGVKGVELEGS
ncbi:MAG: DNA gyrase subunit A, partial [Planctomycetota bacterium]